MSEIHVEPFQILKDAVLQIIHVHRGRAQAINRAELLAELKASGIVFHDEREVREAVSELRRERNMIISSGGRGGGYWMGAERAEYLFFRAHELHPRAMRMLEMEKIMDSVAEELWGVEQLALMQVETKSARSPEMQAIFGG